MSIYDDVIQKISEGASWSVDFKKRVLRINGKPMKLEDDLGIAQYETLDDWLEALEDYFDAFKYSRPTKTSMAKERKAKFRGLSPSQLVAECGHDALNNPLDRDEAQARLEIFILFSLLNGSFKPAELFNKDWFFQGADKDLVLNKDWF